MVSNAKHFSKCQYIDLDEDFDKNLQKVTAPQDLGFWIEVGKPVAIAMKEDPYVSKYGFDRRKYGRICSRQAEKLGVIKATPGQTVRAKVANIISRGDPSTKAGKKKPHLIKSKNQVGWLDLEEKQKLDLEKKLEKSLEKKLEKSLEKKQKVVERNYDLFQ